MNGEFIVRADQTAKYLDVLNAINSGKSLQVPNAGGQTISAPVTQVFSPTINVQGGTSQQNQDMAERMDSTLRAMFRDFYARETTRQMRAGGLFRTT
jgi:hypothetical protein